MQKHLVVALATALSAAGLTAGSAFADREVVVQPGETMQTISHRYYGDEQHVWTITRYNHLDTPDLIYAGLTLRLPELAADGADSGSVGPTGAAISLYDPAAGPPMPAGAPGTSQVAPASPEIDDPSVAAVTHMDGPEPGQIIQSGLATWYGPGFVGNITYCGDVYDDGALTAASNTLPCGAIVIVTNQNNDASVRVRINDRGGFGGNVILDLSRAAFGAIASTSTGVVPVTVSQPAS